MSIIEFPALREAQEKRKAKQDALAAVFSEAGPDVDLSKVKSLDGDTTAKAAAIRTMNDELTDLGKQVDELVQVARAAEAVKAAEEDGEKAGERGDDHDDDQGKATSFGSQFVKSAAFKQKGTAAEIPVDLKTLFQTTAGWAPETTRGPRLVLSAQRPIQMVDIIPQTRTRQTAVTFMEETTFTNNAAETAEGAEKPEGALALTERTEPVRKIAVWIPVTDEQMEDVERIEQYLDNRLPFMVRQRLDGQIISGDGTAPNISGVLDRAGIQTQAKGADPTPDAIYKAMTKVEVTGQAMPGAVVFHPNDWQEVRLLRTADGIYIWGNPSEAGPERIWGLQVVKVQAATEGTAVVGDWQNFSELAVKKDMEVKDSDSHSDFFIKNKRAIRAEIRVAFVVYRPAAFCQVTGV